MNQVDNYLECVQEGKIWDKTKEFVGKHKGKIAAAAGLAAAVYAGKKVSDKNKARTDQQAHQAKNRDAVTTLKSYEKKQEDDKATASKNEFNKKLISRVPKGDTRNLSKPTPKSHKNQAQVLATSSDMKNKMRKHKIDQGFKKAGEVLSTAGKYWAPKIKNTKDRINAAMNKSAKQPTVGM